MAEPSSTEKSDLTTLARGGSLNLVGSAVGAVLAMGLLLVVTWGLGADEGGAFFETLAMFNIVVIAVTFGADTGLLRFTARSLAREEPIGLKKLLIVGLPPVALVGVASVVLAYQFADPISSWLGGADQAGTVRSYLLVMAVFVPLGAVSLAVLGGTRGFGTMLPTVAAERIGRPLIQIVLVSAAALLGGSPASVAGAWSLGVVFSLVAGVVWLRSLSGRRSVPDLPGQSLAATAREFWSFTLPRSLASMFRVGVQWLDIILVGGLMSPRAAAIYTVATRLLQAGFLAVDAIGQAVEPMFSSLLASGAESRAHALYQGATGWLVGLTWPLFLGMWIFSPAILGLFGTEYREATTVVAILAGSALIGSGFGPVDVLLVMAGKSMWSFWNSATSLSLNVGLNFLLIPSLGLNGAAVAWAVSRVVANLLPLIEVRSLYGFHPFGPAWRAGAIASLVTFGALGLIIRELLGSSIWVFLVYVVVALAAYAALVWRWRNRLELAAFAQLLGRRFRPLQVGASS